MRVISPRVSLQMGKEVTSTESSRSQNIVLFLINNVVIRLAIVDILTGITMTDGREISLLIKSLFK
jgi:hypothetical protein